MSSITLDMLVAAVARVAAAPASELSDADLADELMQVRKLADIAEAAHLARLREFDRRAVGESQEALSTKAWLRHHSHVAPAETGRALKIAHGVARLPQVAAALAAGEIRLSHAAAIVDGATLLGHEVIAGCQDALLAVARSEDPTRLRAALRGFGAAVDKPDAVKRAERRDHGRWLDLADTFDGAVCAQGVFGAEDGAIVKAAVDGLSGPVGADDERTPSQRRADALVEICRRHLTVEGSSHHGEAAGLIVVTDLDTIRAGSGGFGELPDGGVLRGDAVRRLSCDASLTRVVLDAPSQPLDVGRTKRFATPAQRTALRLRDGGCRWPGCDRPAEWTEVHHLTRWIDGGRTDIDDLISLCRKHHRRVHEGGWRIRRLGHGELVFLDPDGRRRPGPPNASTRDLVSRLTGGPRHSPRDGPGP